MNFLLRILPRHENLQRSGKGVSTSQVKCLLTSIISKCRMQSLRSIHCGKLVFEVYMSLSSIGSCFVHHAH